MPLRQWIRSANFAIEGILHGARTQRHLRYHFISAATVLLFSYIVGVSRNEFILLALAVILVLLAEMMNTAIETVVDILSPGHSEKARIAKDIAAGAVLITAFGAAVLGYVILFPYLTSLFQEGFAVAHHSAEEISLLSFIIVLILVIMAKSYFGTGLPLRGGLPSGHAALAFSIWVSVSYMTRNVMISLLCLVMAVWITQSRVSAKIHSAREVLLGALMGGLVTYLLFRLFL